MGLLDDVKLVMDGPKKTSVAKTHAPKAVHVDVVRAEGPITVPPNITLDQAAERLIALRDSEEQLVKVNETIDAFPWDGAIALKRAMEARYGMTLAMSKQSFFGDSLPQEITVETSLTTKVTVPWGLMKWPMDTNNSMSVEMFDSKKQYLQTDVGSSVDGRMIFRVGGQIKRKWLPELRSLLDEARRIAREESIYKGKAVRIEFTDDDGDNKWLPTPQFMDLSSVRLDDLIYNKDLEQIIDTFIMTPLRHTTAVRKQGIPLKRGVLAAGPYGTGKTLLANAVFQVGTQNGWTGIYIKNASELPQAIRFARQYAPAVVFAEDVERSASHERTEEVDQLLNTLDGIDTKSAELMVVLTTNHLDQVSKALLRPGRLDVVIEVTPPDAEAVQRLIRTYARGRIAKNADLTTVGELLAGYTPAVIREVVERAKLATIARTNGDDVMVAANDLAIAAKAMVAQQKLLAPPAPVVHRPLQAFAQEFGKELELAAHDDTTTSIRKDVAELLEIHS